MKDFAVGDIVYDSSLGHFGKVIQADVYMIKVYFLK